MKEILSVALLTVSLFTLSVAHTDDSRLIPESMKQRLERLQTELKLDDNQQNQIQAIQARQWQQVSDIRKNFREQVKALLTSEQQTKFVELMQQRVEQRWGETNSNEAKATTDKAKDNRQLLGQRLGERLLDRMQKELSLSQEQSQKIQNLQQEQRSTLLKLHQDTQTKIRAVLTSEQLTKFQQRRPFQPLDNE